MKSSYGNKHVKFYFYFGCLELCQVTSRLYKVTTWPARTGCSFPIAFACFFIHTTANTLMSDSNGGKQVPNDEQGQLKWTPNPDDPFTDCSNAIRQMLFHVEPLRNYFLQHIFLGGQH